MQMYLIKLDVFPLITVDGAGVMLWMIVVSVLGRQEDFPLRFLSVGKKYYKVPLRDLWLQISRLGAFFLVMSFIESKMMITRMGRKR